MQIRISGLQQRREALDNFARGYKNAVRKELIDHSQKMVRDARNDHNFTTRGGGLERSIDAETPPNEMSMKFGIIGGQSDVNWKGKTLSYGVFQHEGTYNGYRKSKAANSYANTTPKTGHGIEADHFIVRAWDKNIKSMIDSIRRIVIEKAKFAMGEM